MKRTWVRRLLVVVGCLAALLLVAALSETLAGLLALGMLYVYGVKVGIAAGRRAADAEWGARAEALGL